MTLFALRYLPFARKAREKQLSFGLANGEERKAALYRMFFLYATIAPAKPGIPNFRACEYPERRTVIGVTEHLRRAI